ncbi:hypothetical protein CWI80_06910 [Pseudidiomarina sediminum]|uniref:Uncharacterized protein n=1 Tax=Pseudidiomarina sediminum TaxID=431675 RepID=A0A432ZAW9_9GAMM|nr:hypothetical protein [Pseudidiomarina sediminum]RUO75050.1 hypothetical protein CWI80_06910 [Pseudidiomarina sediminum]
MKRYLLIFVVLLTLVGCTQPIPQDKLNYVGEWHGDGVYLLISADGLMAYQRVDGSTQIQMQGPLKEFNGDDFVYGFFVWTSTFEVSQAPYFEDGSWYMVVDGVKLKKLTDQELIEL